MNKPNPSEKNAAKEDLPHLYDGEGQESPEKNSLSPWLYRLRLVSKIAAVFAIFIIYAGYAHRSGVNFGGEPTFVDSPGFAKFAKASGIAGMINVTSGWWGRALGVKAPAGQEPALAASGELAGKIVKEQGEEEGMLQEVITEEAPPSSMEPPLEEVLDDAMPLEAPGAGDAEQDPSISGGVQCSDIPDVPWWGNKKQEEAAQYVNSKFDGNWNLYIAKWETHLTKVIDIYVGGKKAMIKATDKVLAGDELADYVNQIEERISVIHCLAKKFAKTPVAAKPDS